MTVRTPQTARQLSLLQSLAKSIRDLGNAIGPCAPALECKKTNIIFIAICVFKFQKIGIVLSKLQLFVSKVYVYGPDENG